jgi:hypothetical protein
MESIKLNNKLVDLIYKPINRGWNLTIFESEERLGNYDFENFDEREKLLVIYCNNKSVIEIIFHNIICCLFFFLCN